MATVTVTNLTSSPLLLQDLYAYVPVAEPLVFERAATDLARMPTLQAAVASGEATVSVQLSAAEIASGLTAVDSTIQAADMAPVASADAAAAPITFYKSFSAGAAGAADDVTIYAVNTLPYKVRLLSAQAFVTTAVGGSTLAIHSAAGGAAPTLALGPISSASTGVHYQSGPNASVVLTPGASVGLFVRRSDRGVAGEVVITARRES